MPQLLAVLRSRFPFFLALCAIVVAYLWSFSAGYRSSLQTFGYLVSIASLIWIFRSYPDPAASSGNGVQPAGLWLPPWDSNTQLRVNEFLAFFVVIGFGVFLRFWRWNLVPYGLWLDEINFFANGLRVLDGAPTHFFGAMPLLPEKPGWVPDFNFYNYYVALSVTLFGSGHFGIKMLSILPGCATLLGFYWLLREIRGPRLAVIGTLMLSMSRWHLTHSRMNSCIVLMVAAGVFGLASVFRGLRTRRLQWVALGGVLIGLTPYFYIAGWLIAAGVFGWLAALTVFGQRECPKFRLHSLSALMVCIFSFLVAAGPNLLFIYTDTEAGMSRVREVSGGVVNFKKRTIDWEKAGTGISLHIEAIVKQGPDFITMNIPGEPMLLPVVSVLSVVGACAQLAFRRGIAHSMAWSIFFFAILGGALTRGSNVATQRIVFALPILYLWAAYGLEIVGNLLQYLGSLIRERFGSVRASWIRYAVGTFLAFAILYPGLLDVNDYFGRFAELKSDWGGFSKEVLASNAARQYADSHQVWIDDKFLRRNKATDVLFWLPKKEVDGKVIGGLDDPWYQMVSYTDWKSLPGPEVGKPIAFLTTLERSRKLANVFEGLESRDFSNWQRNAPLFAVSFIDPTELEEKLAEVRMNSE